MPSKVSKVRWKCKQCQKSLWLKPHKARVQQFCSRQCMYKSLRVENPVRAKRGVKRTFGEQTCVECKNAFTAKSAHQKYCGQGCALDAIHNRNKDTSTKERPCEFCGITFRPRPWSAGRFCSRSCTYQGQTGEKAAHWRGGRYTTKDGYVKVYAPDHPAAQGHGGYVAEHRLVMEQSIGRYLLPAEEVHHKFGPRDDNRIERLELWTKSQPAGQRVEDLVKWAREILQLYGTMFP